MTELDLRPAELAGRWYPATPAECDALLPAPDTQAGLPDLPDLRVGAIVPHAGWAYSGAVAFEALAAVAAARPDADVLVVFGGHLGPRDDVRVFLEGGWETPYGPVPVPEDLAARVSMALSAEPETPEEYYDDNAVEVLMPMLAKLWPGVPALIVGVPPTDAAGDVGAEAVTQLRAAGFARPVIVGSTDLTHYGPNYRYNPSGRGWPGHAWVTGTNDPEVIQAMVTLDPAKTLWVAQRSRNACSPGAVAAALVAARRLGATRGAPTRYTTSWDARPEGTEPLSFVGYVGLVLGDGSA